MEGTVMNNFTARAALGIAAICLASAASAQTPAQPTGTTGATAFQPAGSQRGEAEANTNSSTGINNGNAGMQQASKPGFDNKPPKGAKADCHRPQGGVDASGGENINSSSKDNTACTGSGGKSNKSDQAKPADKR
jgi:hypothetical protein